MCFTVNFAAEPAGGAYTLVFYDKDFGHFFPAFAKMYFHVCSYYGGQCSQVFELWNCSNCRGKLSCRFMITKLALILQNLTYMYITLCDGSNSFWTKSFWTLDRRDFPPKKKKKKPSIIPQNTLLFFYFFKWRKFKDRLIWLHTHARSSL